MKKDDKKLKRILTVVGFVFAVWDLVLQVSDLIEKLDQEKEEKK